MRIKHSQEKRVRNVPTPEAKDLRKYFNKGKQALILDLYASVSGAKNDAERVRKMLAVMQRHEKLIKSKI